MRIPHRWIWRAAIFIVVLTLLIFYHRSSRKPSRAQAASPPAVPVVTTVAKTGDQPIYLNGLGAPKQRELVWAARISIAGNVVPAQLRGMQAR